MHSNWWIDSLLLVACLSQAILFATIFRQSARRFPSLLAYSAFELSLHGALYLLRPHYAVYYWTYWISQGVIAALRLWILADAIRSIPCSDDIPRFLRRLIFATATAIGAGSSVIAYRSTHLKLIAGIAMGTFKFSAAINIAICVFSIIVIASLLSTRLGWIKPSSNIAAAVLLQSFGVFLSSWLLTKGTPTARLQANLISSLSEILPTTIWAYSLWRKYQLRDLTKNEAERYERLFSFVPGLSISRER